MTPSCVPSTRPASSTTSPGSAAPGRSFSTSAAYLPLGTKQMSWLSGFAATGRSKRRASARVSSLARPPSGKRRKSSCARGVVKVLPGAARPLLAGGGAVIIKLQGDADDVEPGLDEERRGDGAVDAARHGGDDARARRKILHSERVHRSAVHHVARRLRQL